MFAGKNIIITGGSSGLGKVLAQRMAREGANLALIARDPAKLEAARDQIARSIKNGQRITAMSCDVSDYPNVVATFKTITETLGRPQILINSAGVITEGYFENMRLEKFREVMDINFFGTLNCIKAILPYFRQQGGGTIVNMCSMGGRMGGFGYSVYCSSKYAVHGLTDALRGELKPQKIRFHLVCPPEFESPMVEELNKYRTRENRRVVQTLGVLDVDTVADAVIKGMRKSRYLIIPGRMTRFLDTSNRVFPFASRLITDLQTRLAYRGPGKT
jgi:3-dehydrosphinganine reductase